MGGATRSFVWDASARTPLLLMDGADAYVYGPDGTPLERISASGTVTYVHSDQLGSVRALTDSAGGVVGTFAFDPYGNSAGTTGTTTLPFGFAGEYRDSESGFVYLRARHYDPTTGQFLSVDPMVAVSGSPYGYAAGDPLNVVDPSGMLCVTSWNCVKKTGGQAAKAVAAGASVAGNVADGIAMVAAVVPGGQGVAAVAFSVGRGMDVLEAGGNCLAFAAGEGSGGDCLKSTAFAVVPNAVEKIVAPARYIKGRPVWDQGGHVIRGGIGVFSDLLSWAMSWDPSRQYCPTPYGG